MRFNTAGPCNPEWHYMVPAAERLPAARRYIANGDYFVVHAPRQSGKSTTLQVLAKEITREGIFAALHFTCETGEPAGDDTESAQQAILYSIRRRAELHLPADLQPPPWPDAPANSALSAALTAWAKVCPRRLCLFFDEIDALRGDSLISVLRQIRAGFADRPSAFPWSIALCGLRDVRDYKAASGGDPERLGTSSPFNIKLASTRLDDFTLAEVESLYQQHTTATGQPFSPDAVALAFELSAGQPWLVNALAREIIEEMEIAPPEPICVEHVERAKERLVLARATHLDSLSAKLEEPRVRRVLTPILAGDVRVEEASQEDIGYARDLGLVAPDDPLRIANPMYREVIVRDLSGTIQGVVTAQPRSFLLADGRLDMGKLMTEFAAFWREHGEVLEQGLSYREVAPQLVLMAFLQRVVNGGGQVEREYGIGRDRIDLLVKMPVRDGAGQRTFQREAIELKVWTPKKKDPLEKGLSQLESYLDRLGLDRGHLVIFDRRPEASPIEERLVFQDARTPKGYPVRVLRA